MWDDVRPFVGVIVAVVLTVFAPWGGGFWATVGYGAIAGASGSAANGGTLRDVIKGAGVGAVSSAAFYGVGTAFNDVGAGGNFLGSGMKAGAFIGEIGAHAMVVGGTASKISGGKFANGAMTGAFSQALGDELQSKKTDEVGTIRAKDKDELREKLKAQGWDGKEDIMFTGERKLGGKGFMRISDKNANVLHEQVFGFTEGGEKFVNIGFAGSTDDVAADKAFSFEGYGFSKEIFSVDINVVRASVVQQGVWNTTDYKLLSHNCQDFADAMRNEARKH